MMHSNKTLAQQIISACVFYGVKQIVVSPGSRNAPLIIELNAINSIKKYSVVDERSAGFFALGMAKQSQEPVALVCSSGSALLNYYPAIAEAFYSTIPLVVISADRPKHLIDIGDGQTIRQENVFENHILFSANLDDENPDKNYNLLNTAFKKLLEIQGPIHINAPFDEPLYKVTSQILVTNNNWIKTENKDSLLSETPLDVEELQVFADSWNKATKKMIVLGAYPPDEMLQTQLNYLAKDSSVIVLTENTSNIHNPSFINSIDQVIFSFSENDYKAFIPEILVTFGGMVVSKKIKQFLRTQPPKQHWHIHKNTAMDTYHCLSHHFEISPSLFFSQFFFLSKNIESDYQNNWLTLKKNRLAQHNNFVKKATFSDFKVFSIINKFAPKQLNIQFSNSSTIRYAQLFSWKNTQIIGCNRGTSGIDGSTSTAVGVSVVSKNQTLFITGDISFFYDSNALWNKYIPNNFRVVIINNKGGGIFRFIPGPTTTDTLEYFETPHNLTAEQLCKMHNFDYQIAQNKESLVASLTDFFKPSSRPKLLEILTPTELNATVLKEYFS